jgi:iodotyrosine deiodinase
MLAEVKEDEFSEDNTLIASALPDDLAHVPLTTYVRYSEKEMVKRSQEFFNLLNNRRTLRFYSTEDVPKEVIENIVKAGGECI